MEVFRTPRTEEGKYEEVLVRKIGEKVSALFKPDTEFEVAELLGESMTTKKQP